MCLNAEYSSLTLYTKLKFAENPATRKKAQEGYEDRLKINVSLLDKALELRRKIASLLGYKTWYGLFYTLYLYSFERSCAGRTISLKSR
jgi:Zn-dependent oligopeptidase